MTDRWNPKRLTKTYSSFFKIALWKLKYQSFLSVEFSCHSNSQIYMENSRKKFFYLLLFFSDDSADCKSGVVPSANVNKTETVFKRKNADVCQIALFYNLFLNKKPYFVFCNVPNFSERFKSRSIWNVWQTTCGMAFHPILAMKWTFKPR